MAKTERDWLALMVCNGTISSQITPRHRHAVSVITIASLIEFVIELGSIMHAAHFFTELAMKAGETVLAAAW